MEWKLIQVCFAVSCDSTGLEVEPSNFNDHEVIEVLISISFTYVDESISTSVLPLTVPSVVLQRFFQL